jgi:DNA (cytosine-5)-methyltransferase 1
LASSHQSAEPKRQVTTGCGMTWAFYNEIDPYCAEWLRNLIRAGHIAPGYVDERSILDVNPDDLREFGQCHFFAGLGAWSLAFRKAGIPDDWPWWSGSAPCQPFSGAGKGGGFADERHLWPAFDWLIGQRRPDVVFGEQVSSPDGRSWYDLVSSDLEGHGYACGAVIAPAAGVGAFHQRHRMYWCAALADAGQSTGERNARNVFAAQTRFGGARIVDGNLSERHQHGGDAYGMADAASARRLGAQPDAEGDSRNEARLRLSSAVSGFGSVAEPDEGERRRWAEHGGGFLDGSDSGRAEDHGQPAGRGGTEFLADDDDDDERLEGRAGAVERGAQRAAGPRSVDGELADAAGSRHDRSLGDAKGDPRDKAWLRVSSSFSGPNGQQSSAIDAPWRDADWLLCRDGKWRPVSPSAQQMVDGSAPSLGRVRPETVASFKEALDAYVVESKIDEDSLLRGLFDCLSAEAKCCWTAGRIPGLCEAPFLLAFLRQLKEQGWRDEIGVPASRAESDKANLRSVRLGSRTTRSPHRLGLEEQRNAESSDVVFLLSSFLARATRQAWSEAYEAYAETQNPLTTKAKARIGRLRAYGNAIVWMQASEFIKAYLDITRTVETDVRPVRVDDLFG